MEKITVETKGVAAAPFVLPFVFTVVSVSALLDLPFRRSHGVRPSPKEGRGARSVWEGRTPVRPVNVEVKALRQSAWAAFPCVFSCEGRSRSRRECL